MTPAISTAADDENPIAGDLQIVNGDLLWHGFPKPVTTAQRATEDVQEIAQRIRSRLRFFKGEWFLDLRQGTPWFQRVMRKGVTEATIRALMIRAIQSVQGVIAVTSMRLSFQREARTMTITFTARCDGGVVFDSRGAEPFVIPL